LAQAKKLLVGRETEPDLCRVFEATFKDNFIIVFFVKDQTRTLVDKNGLRLSYTLAEAYDVLCGIGLRSFNVVRQPEPLPVRPFHRQDDEPIKKELSADYVMDALIRVAAKLGMGHCDICTTIGTSSPRIRSAMGLSPSETKTREKKPKTYAGQDTYDSLNADCEAPEKTAGFWREKPGVFGRGTQLPFPVALKLKSFDAQAFLVKLASVESKATSAPYKGWSTHRWDGSRNGSSDFKYKGWKWPSGYSTYIKQGVLPSASFFKFIMGYELEGLPPF
jgi:hypothetical protein